MYFSGHGRNGALLMQDGQRIEVENLVSRFKGNTALSEMAKMFFIDACRGPQEDFGFAARARFAVSGGSRVPEEGNILVAYASTEDHVSKGDNFGSQWTNFLIQALKNSDESDDVCNILTSSNKMLRAYQLTENRDSFQTAEFTTSLTTFVHFKRER